MSRRKRSGTALGLLCLIMGGCSIGGASDEGESIAVTDQEPVRIAVTRDDRALPPSCRPRQVASRLVRFGRALESADEEELEQLWGPGFKWFSIGREDPSGKMKDGDHFLGRTQEEALGYVRDHTVPMAFESIQLARGRPGSENGVDVVYQGSWEPESGPDAGFIGKGYLLCGSPTIKVWSMAVKPEPIGPRLCPEPPTRRDARDVVVACARFN